MLHSKSIISQFLVSSIVGLSLIGCAQEREIEKLKTPDQDQHLKSLFTGSTDQPTAWIYKATVVKNSTNGGFAFVGYQNDAKVGYFKVTKDKLKLYNLNSPFQELSENATPEILNEWDITHHDVALAETDGKVSNREVEDPDKTWKEKRFLKIDFAKADVSEAADFPYSIDIATQYQCWSKKASHLVDDSFKISPDYLTFVVSVDYQMNTLCSKDIRRDVRGDFTYSVQYRYSFKKLTPTEYEPYVYAQGEKDPLSQKYGYFKTIREEIDPVSGRFKNKILMNRWDPNKEHHFFFTKDFPEEFKWMFNHPKRGIFARTNEVFKSEGLKIRFHIHENRGVNGKTKEFGDIRYSFVNFITELDPQAPFGYGPSDANPFTGELISANLMVWTGYMKYYMQRVKNGIEQRTLRNAGSSSSLMQKMADLLKGQPKDWASSFSFEKDAAGDVFHSILQKNTYGYPFWSTFTTHDPTLKKKVFQPISPEKMDRILSASPHHEDVLDFNEEMEKVTHQHIDHLIQGKKLNAVHTTVFPIEPMLADARKALIDGEDFQTIFDTILYRVSIHEFGHNLNLRHNFYGTVDKKNFAPDRVVKLPDGTQKSYPAMSSSVMDYLSLQDEIHLERDWESYDKAALLFAYSSGKVDSKKKHMFCTDEHRPLNAMCGTWDRGSTPTEAIMSLVESYDDLYSVLNFRGDRAYWNTSGYASRMFSTMWAIKKFLILWRTDFTPAKIKDALKDRTDLSSSQRESLAKTIDEDMKEAVRIAVAFFNAVIQQSDADRPWRSEIDTWTGSMNRIGILYDKVFAMRFLVGDEGFMYNPNASFNNASYLSYLDIPQLTSIIDTVFENAVTSRVDMDTWFLSYARTLFAINASNFANMADLKLIDRMKVSEFTPAEMKLYFNLKITNETDTEILRLSTSSHPDFLPGNEEVAFTRVGGKFYMTSKAHPYAFNVIQSIKNDIGSRTVMREKMDIVELHRMYQVVRGLDH